jgi:hypothetical protein
MAAKGRAWGPCPSEIIKVLSPPTSDPGNHELRQDLKGQEHREWHLCVLRDPHQKPGAYHLSHVWSDILVTAKINSREARQIFTDFMVFFLFSFLQIKKNDVCFFVCFVLFCNTGV